MKILHVCAGWQQWNGAANIARMIMDEQRREGHDVQFATWASVRQLRSSDEVWIHCGWLPCLWWAAVVCFLTRNRPLRVGATHREATKPSEASAERRRGAERVLKWMPEACYDPVRLKYHGWKKWLVGPVERWCLRRCDRIVATCEAEKGWIEAYLGNRCPPIEVTDIKRFFKLQGTGNREQGTGNREQGTGNREQGIGKALHLLYLGRRHPLKGLEYLEEAVRQISSVPSSLLPVPPQLKVVSNAFGEEKERVWAWCDVLVLPTLSENFGLVVAEALERGKRVITTDGAPAWGEEVPSARCQVPDASVGEGVPGASLGFRVSSLGEGENSRVEHVERVEGDEPSIRVGYGGRLLYLVGYRDGSANERVRLLKEAIETLNSKLKCTF